MRFPWSRHTECVADPAAYCVEPGCNRSATHVEPFAVSDTGDLIEQLTCCRHVQRSEVATS